MTMACYGLGMLSHPGSLVHHRLSPLPLTVLEDRVNLGLENRRAVVAAATSGLGLAAARALIAEGARVVICGRDEGRLAAAAKQLGSSSVPIRADVSTADGAAAFVRAARSELGGVDILIANGGGPPAGTFASTDLAQYPAALELNLLSVVAMCTEAVPDMRAQGWGRVVAITSIAVRQPLPNLILSNTARAGVTGFLKTLAREVARDGVTVNSVLPAYHATERVRRLHGGDWQRLGDELPVGRVGDPDDFGSTVAFLCSRQAGFITGTAVPVDGGFHAALW